MHVLSLPLLQPPQEPGAFSQAQLRLKMEKYKLLFGAKSLISRQRPIHRLGLGALGVATVVSNPVFPAHELFTLGRSFPVRIRLSSPKEDDDAAVDLRAIGVKFADNDMGSPLDLLMITGRECFFWNIPSLDDFTAYLTSTDKVQGWKDYIAKDPH